jgi:hypothetical protein
MTTQPNTASNSPVVPAAWGGLFGFLTSLIFNVCLPSIRRWWLTQSINVTVDQTQCNHARCRVSNAGYWTVKNAIIYLRLPFTKGETLDPPPGHQAHIRPDNFVPLDEEQLCWSVRSPAVNPMKVDIYAKERQPFSPCALTDPGDAIIIPSEDGWHPTGPKEPVKRVFLRRKNYAGFLKVVSEDTNGRFFRINITAEPFGARINSASKADWDAAACR